jgi:hypothetical protein
VGGDAVDVVGGSWSSKSSMKQGKEGVMLEQVNGLLMQLQVGLVAQQDRVGNAEKVGKGAADAFDGISGFFSSVADDSQWGRWIGYALLIAAGLWLLRKLGILRG